MDYYNILEINKNATEDEIKKAYRKKALLCHPDKTGGDDLLFKQVNEAYETLSDPQKRHIYDNPNQHQNIHMNNDMFENIFRSMGININGQNVGQNKRPNSSYNIKISLKDAYIGLQKTLKLNILKKCFKCLIHCNDCGGNGHIIHRMQNGPFVQQIQTTCNKCSGTGIITNVNKCEECNVNYEIVEEKIIKVSIPQYVEHGFNIVYKGFGEQIKKKGEEPGDLVITILIEDDPYFIREKNNLIFKSKITLAESIVGKTFNIPHFDGLFEINCNVFGIINPHKRYHLKGKGLSKDSDLIFIFEIIYPDKTINQNEINLLTNMFKNMGL